MLSLTGFDPTRMIGESQTSRETSPNPTVANLTPCGR